MTYKENLDERVGALREQCTAEYCAYIANNPNDLRFLETRPDKFEIDDEKYMCDLRLQLGFALDPANSDKSLTRPGFLEESLLSTRIFLDYVIAEELNDLRGKREIIAEIVCRGYRNLLEDLIFREKIFRPNANKSHGKPEGQN